MRASTKTVFPFALVVGMLFQSTRAVAQDSTESVRIGTQVWMAKNLNVDRFRNGDPIPEAKTAEEWKKAGRDHTPAWSCYDNAPDNCENYGRLYNWYAVNDPRGLAPGGWHIPTKSDWVRSGVTRKWEPVSPLAEFDILETRAGLSGNALKAIGQGTGDGAGTNTAGFSALLAGWRDDGGVFAKRGEQASFWSTSPSRDGRDLANALFLDHKSNSQSDDPWEAASGLSVRCIRDWQQDAAEPPAPLTVGLPIVRQIQTGDVHIYHVTLDAGQYLRTLVTPRVGNALVRVMDPEGRQIVEVGPSGARKPDTAGFAAKTSGRYVLGVIAYGASAAAGEYEIRIAERLTAAQYQVVLAEDEAKLAVEKAVADARFAAEAKAASAPATSWLASHAIRLRAVEAGNGFDDMQPLKQIIGNAHLVALGEATHGTREFFQLKHRMLEFLVTEMGFTVFGIEATMPEAYAINEYVLTGKGDPARALAALYFWTWDTEEVLEMIRWMRQYNADPSHLKKVKFYGFDMQSVSLAAKVTIAYLRQVNPEQAVVAATGLSQLANSVSVSAYPQADANTKTATIKAMNSVLTDLDARRSDYVGKTSAAEWTVARQHASLVAQYLENWRPGNTAFVRDSAMASNIRWILDHEGPGTKMVVWAHNLHVATRARSMGGELRKALGSDMVVFGFAFNQGSFRAHQMPSTGNGPRAISVGRAPDGSLDATLAAAGLQVAAIDLRTLPSEGAEADWFSLPREMREIGAAFSSDQQALVPRVTPKLYDALLFVAETTPSRLLESNDGQLPRILGAPTNLDLEAGDRSLEPEDWTTPPNVHKLGFVAAISSDRPYHGNRSGVLSRSAEDHYGDLPGRLIQRLDAAAYRGKRIRLRVMARTNVTGEGNHAYVRLRIEGSAGGPTFDNLTALPVTSADWRAYEVEADVPADAGPLSYGVWLIGSGRVWMDAVSIEVVPKVGK